MTFDQHLAFFRSVVVPYLIGLVHRLTLSYLDHVVISHPANAPVFAHKSSQSQIVSLSTVAGGTQENWWDMSFAPHIYTFTLCC